jgi:hypothetical protein
MMLVETIVRESPIHGSGLFAKAPIPKGTRVWQFSRAIDHEIPQWVFVRFSKRERRALLDRGYINPHQYGAVVQCGDEAMFMNFPLTGELPNVELGGVVDGEDVLVAARDIEAGEELTVTPASDADYERKMEGWRQTPEDS